MPQNTDGVVACGDDDGDGDFDDMLEAVSTSWSGLYVTPAKAGAHRDSANVSGSPGTPGVRQQTVNNMGELASQSSQREGKNWRREMDYCRDDCDYSKLRPLVVQGITKHGQSPVKSPSGSCFKPKIRT